MLNPQLCQGGNVKKEEKKKSFTTRWALTFLIKLVGTLILIIITKIQYAEKKKKTEEAKSDVRNTTHFTTNLYVTNHKKMILAIIYYIVGIH